MKQDTLYIVIPAYNEQDNIRLVVEEWHPIVEKIGIGSFLLIVNDGSKDKTAEILYELQTDYPQLLVVNKTNSGHGATCLLAYREAIKTNVDYVFQTDSDGQTTANEFWPFWENRHLYDFQIGHRKFRKDGQSRLVITKVLQLVVWATLGEKVLDANTPFRLMKTERLKSILKVITEDSFLSNAFISAVVVKWKERYAWHPITFKPRKAGESFVNLKKITKIGWRVVKDFRKGNLMLKQTDPRQLSGD